jgi:hypothetical protein
MPHQIETHPVRTQWVATLGTVVLMAVLMPLADPRPFVQHLPAILGAGLGVFLVTADLRRRSREAQGDEASRADIDRGVKPDGRSNT